MKKILFILSFFAIVVSFSACDDKAEIKKFSGYIPIGAKPQLIWVHDNQSGTYDVMGYILVVTPDGKKLHARFTTSQGWVNSWYVIYRDTYPLVANELVFVEGYYDEKGTPRISGASR